MESSPSRSSAANSPPLVFFLALHRMLLLGGLKHLRDQMSNEGQSAFKINSNGELLIIAIAALLVIELTSVMLFAKLRRACYTALKYLVSFLGYIAPIALMMVVDVSGDKDWKTYADLVSYGLFGIMVAYVSLDDGDKKCNKSSYIYSGFTFAGLVLVPLALVLVLYVPVNVNWIAYYVVWLSVVVEAVGLAYLLFMFFMPANEEEEAKAQTLEVYQDKKKAGLEAQKLIK